MMADLERVALRDERTGAAATVLVGFGFNCYQFCVQRPGGPLEILWSEDGFASGQKRASGSGIPLLFPFAGRLRGTVFHWEGREYPQAAGDGRGNALHGFVLDRPWRILERQPDSVRGQFQASLDGPELLERWPADFRVTVTYQLRGEALETRLLVENPDTRPLPFGLGTHPYFRLPLGGPSGEDCIVKLPVAARWELVEMQPTGRRLPLEDAAAFAAGQRFERLTLDDAFTDLQFEGAWCTAEIRDPASGVCLRLQFDRGFRECIVYTPPHRQAICIEPETCVPNAFELQGQGIDAGLRILDPGAAFEAVIVMQVV
jgi:aldose 1-epimerase